MMLPRIWGYVGALAIGASLALTVQNWRHDARLARVVSDHTSELARIERDHHEALTIIRNHAEAQISAAVRAHRESVLKVAEIDRQYSQEREYAQREIDSLRDAVAVGTQRLRVQATCPSSSPDSRLSGSSGATRTPGLDDGTAVELSESARLAYFRLRQSVTEDAQKILALQAYVRTLLDYCSGKN